jgi:hypothetical protein
VGLVDEQVFDSGPEALLGVEPYDFAARLDHLRCHPNDVLRKLRDDARARQQQWRLEELAITRVLDEREALDDVPDPTISARTAKTAVDVARALERQPAIAAAAHAGRLSWDQLVPVVELATPETDAEWAARGARTAPIDLHRLARRQRPVPLGDAQARAAARFVRMWRNHPAGMAEGRWSLPDVKGVLVEKVLDHMAERMRPAKGQPWDTLAHRRADALVTLCEQYADVEPTGRFKYLVMIQHPVDGVPEVDGIPLAQETVDALLPNAVVRETTSGQGGVPRSTKRKPIPADVERHVRLRDLHCRTPGCEETRRLDLHHLDPVTFGGANKIGIHDVVGICKWCHPMYEPHGPYRLVGDPEQPDGLTLVHRDDPPPDDPPPDARAGPDP